MPILIMPYLWLGNYNDCVYLPQNIHVIVNCTDNVPFFHTNVVNLRLPINKTIDEFDIVNLWNSTKMFDDVIKSIMFRKNVMFHCKDGYDSSASTIVAFLMKMNRLSKEDAKKLVKRKVGNTYINLNSYDDAFDIFSINLASKHINIVEIFNTLCDKPVK